EQRDRSLLEGGMQQPPLRPDSFGQAVGRGLVRTGRAARNRASERVDRAIKLGERRIEQRLRIGIGKAGRLAKRVTARGKVRQRPARPSALRHLPAFPSQPRPTFSPYPAGSRRRTTDITRSAVMALILLVLILAILFGGLGFALHALWWIAAIILILWRIGFAVRAGEGRRWYRW